MNKQIESINLSEAKRLCEAAIELAKEKKVSIAVTVIDARGMGLCTLAMEDTLLVSPSLSRKKALTALHVQVPTVELQKQGVEVANFGQDYCTFGGGIPIRNRKKIIGAIGISGMDTGQKDNDFAVQVLGRDNFELNKRR